MPIDPNRPDPAAQRYLDLAARFRSRAPGNTTFVRRRERKTFLHVTGLTEFRGATVLAGEWLVLAGDRVLCDFFVQTPSPPMTAYLTHFDFGDDVIELIHELTPNVSIPRAFLLGGCGNFSHWLLDYLPRLRFGRDPSLPMLVNGPLTSFQSESLRLVGIDDGRLIQVEYPGTVSVEHLFYPSICSSSITPPHPFQDGVLDWLREAFAPLMATERRDRKIFISRGEEAEPWRRRLLNHEEIAGIARRHGFEILALECLGFADQVRLFAQAAVIVGAHGAGFANMVFAPKGTELVELIGPRLGASVWSMEYAGIARLSRQNFTRIVGRAVEPEAIRFDHLPYETYMIDPEEFESVLRAR